ncbi:hypothetical protein, partial [uncultured Duncaniella sp.]|uniref:hypothetical protein n=1 Tax=uncultured Duncaniella sp. TaxID=2768039 RepID=UPI002649A4B6
MATGKLRNVGNSNPSSGQIRMATGKLRSVGNSNPSSGQIRTATGKLRSSDALVAPPRADGCERRPKVKAR